jgi:hypothetical protein
VVSRVENRDYHYLSQLEIGGSIKGDVNKKASPSADSREVFCLDIQPTVCRYASRSLERFGSGLLFRSLGSFSSSDNVRRLLKLGKRFDFVANHGSIRGSWPIAISGSPRGHSVGTVTRC